MKLFLKVHDCGYMRSFAPFLRKLLMLWTTNSLHRAKVLGTFYIECVCKFTLKAQGDTTEEQLKMLQFIECKVEKTAKRNATTSIETMVYREHIKFESLHNR